MNLYNIPFVNSIPAILKNLIVGESNSNDHPYLIIAPNKRAAEVCKHEFNFTPSLNNKVIVLAISDTKELLQEFFKLAQPNLKIEITKLLKLKIINPNTREFLLAKLVKAAKPGITLENSLTLATELATLLDILAAEDIATSNLKQFSTLSTFAEDILNLLITIDKHWHNILLEIKLQDILSYKTKVFNLIAEVLQNTSAKTNIIIFAIDNYSNATTNLLKAIANYNYGKVVFSGIDFYLSEDAWNNLLGTHPQYINSQILGKLKVARKNIKPLILQLGGNKLLQQQAKANKAPLQQITSKELLQQLPLAKQDNRQEATSTTATNIAEPNFIARIFDQLVYKIPPTITNTLSGNIKLASNTVPISPNPTFSSNSKKQPELFHNSIQEEDIAPTKNTITNKFNTNLQNTALSSQVAINNISYIEVTNEETEAGLIAELIKAQLKQSSSNRVTIVTTNIDLTKRISFKLLEEQITVDSSFGVELSRTENSIFFKLIATIDLTNINFVNLLALLKHPLCSLTANKHYAYLIDLLLARTILPNKSLPLYLKLLNQLLHTKKITNEEYYNLSQILTSLEAAYHNFSKLINQATFNFKEALALHISLAERLGIKTAEKDAAIWQKEAGESLKAALDSILLETDFLPAVTLEEYNNILQLLLKQHNVRSPLNNKARVFICGILQAQFITSNTVILPDLNEGSFPLLPKSGIAFINYLLEQLKLPSKFDSIGKEAFIFNKLCSYHKVYLTRSIKKQNLVATPSRFITKLLNTLAANNLQLNNCELTTLLNKLETHPKPLAISNTNKTCNKNNNYAIAANPEVALRPKIISATTVEKLLKNPYLFFIENILNLTILPALNPEFDAKLQGNLVHETLHTLLHNHGDKLHSLSLPELKELLLITAKSNFAPYMLQQTSAVLAFNVFKHFINDLSSALYDLLQNSNHINSEVSGKILLNEPIEPALTKEESNLTIKGRADCIAINNNSAIIIDFKTGNFKLSKADLESFRKQLIILGYLLTNQGFYTKHYKINSLEYWVLPNNFSDKFNRINLAEAIKEDNLTEYLNNDFALIEANLNNYLLTQKPFKLNLKHKELPKEYQHFSRKDEAITTENQKQV